MNLPGPWQRGMDRVADAFGQRCGAIEDIEVVLEGADEVVVACHAVPTFGSSRASASMASRRYFNA